MSDAFFTRAGAFLEDQRTCMGDHAAQQWVTLAFTDDDDQQLAVCDITSHEARELAFRLLVLAERADRRANGSQDAA